MYLLIDKLHATIADEFPTQQEAIRALTLDAAVDLFMYYYIAETDDEGNITQSFVEDDLLTFLGRE